MSNWSHSASWFPELQLTNWNGNCNCNSSRKNRLNGSGNGNCDFQKMSHSTPIPLQFTLQFYLGSIFLAHYYSVFPPKEILDKNASFKTPSSRVKKTVDILFFFNTWVFETKRFYSIFIGVLKPNSWVPKTLSHSIYFIEYKNSRLIFLSIEIVLTK